MPQRTTQAVQPPEATEPAPPHHSDEILDRQTDQIVERAAQVGQERLDRSPADILITGFLGGVDVSLGALAAMLVVGAALQAAPGIGLYGALALGGLVFPVGFLFVILGRSELFTENFLIPVVSVLKREETIGSLLTLWLLSLIGNLVGCATIASLINIPQAIGAPILAGYKAYSQYKLQLPPVGVLGSAILAGLIMTVLTWQVVAVRHPVGKLLIIWAAGYLVFATNVSHVVVTAAIVFADFVPLGYSVPEVLRWLGIATAGNLLGGVGFVTFFRLAQVRERKRSVES
ncbi:MAG TPA: formate/nitrite transporter family protein [Chloroflexota bacterium]|nr:formate/nitrite transporter family protein [Chloroflexota bacterium]